MVFEIHTDNSVSAINNEEGKNRKSLIWNNEFHE